MERPDEWNDEQEGFFAGGEPGAGWRGARRFGGRFGGRRGMGRRGGHPGGGFGGPPPFGGGPVPPVPPFFGGGPTGWHGRRARRGEVRMALLGLLAERPMHGYELMRELESRSGGMWRPSPGSVYPTLEMLEDQGLVTSSEVEGRRTFAISEAGRGELAERAEGPPPWDMGDEIGEEVQGLRAASMQLGAAVMQLARLGSRERMQQALDILKEARRRIYTLLAEAD